MSRELAETHWWVEGEEVVSGQGRGRRWLVCVWCRRQVLPQAVNKVRLACAEQRLADRARAEADLARYHARMRHLEGLQARGRDRAARRPTSRAV